MSATETLSSTTLDGAVGASDGQIKVASTSGIRRGYRLYLDGELMEVLSLGVDPFVNVIRGVDGTKGSAHVSGATVYIGQGHQFYNQDPVGRPADSILVSPYINVKAGRVWFARGDNLPSGTANRYWQLQTATYGTGPLGVATTTYDPTAST